MGWQISVIEKVLDLLKILFSKKKMPSDALIDSINIRLLAEELVNGNINVDCFFIVMVHNSGGKLRPDNFMFWSIIDGFCDDEQKMKSFEFKRYQLVNTDIDFLQLARRIYEKKEVNIRVSEMSSGSLHTSYAYERLTYIRFYHLKQDKRALWFAMAGTTAQDEHLDSLEQEGKIFFTVNQVKNIIRDY